MASITTVNHSLAHRLGSRQGRVYFKITVSLVIAASFAHLILGADPFVVIMGATAFLLSLIPIFRYDVFNIGAILMALIGLRYIGFAIFAKLAVGQTLDSYLQNPRGAAGVVLVGITGYLCAFMVAAKLSTGRPFIKPVLREKDLGNIAIMTAIIGMVSALALTLQAGQKYSGIAYGNFFVSFLHLALICGIARVLIASDMSRAVNGFVIVILAAEITFGMIVNYRMILMETFLCYVITVSSFHYKIYWRQLLIIAMFIALIVVFVTPVFLYARAFRDEQSWAQRIETTMVAVMNWREVYKYYLVQDERIYNRQSNFNYYGKAQNVFERLSYIKHVDVLKVGTDNYGLVGAEDFLLGIKRAMPRIILPDKPRGFSHGDWLYNHIAIQHTLGNYATAPLIGNGYAAFGWMGAFFYPFIFGCILLVIVKKISGLSLQNNIWAIYLLLRIQNNFVEGSSGTYIVEILRMLPQDFIIIYCIKMFGERFVIKRNCKTARVTICK